MTNTLEIVPASIVADSPFIDKKASPIIGKNVKFKPTPKPIAKPFLFFPVFLQFLLSENSSATSASHTLFPLNLYPFCYLISYFVSFLLFLLSASFTFSSTLL